MIPQSAKRFALRARLTAVAVAGTVALAGGAASAAPPAAPTATTADNVTIAAYPCGLSGEMRSHMIPGWNWYHYRIRNCHDYDVRRRLNVTNSVTDDGPCALIPARGIAFMPRHEFNTQFDMIIGLSRC